MIGTIIFSILIVSLIVFAYISTKKKAIDNSAVIPVNPPTSNIINVIVVCKDQEDNYLSGINVSFGQYANPSLGITNIHGEAYCTVDNTVDNAVIVNNGVDFTPISCSTKNSKDQTTITFTKK